MSETLVIIGAGFSGIVTFYRLLTSAQHAFDRIVLVDDGQIGGVAYGLAGEKHLLNVPAGRMSALVEDRNHFLQFARYVTPLAQAYDFLPRRLYAAYLRWMLETSKRKAAPDLKAICIRDRAVDISISRRGIARILLQSGKTLSAHKIVIATGNQQAATARSEWLAKFSGSPRYSANPWHADAWRKSTTTQPLLLVGSSLTAVDIALSINSRRPQQPIIMVSRRGLLPQAHRGLAHELEMPVDVGPILNAPARVGAMLQTLRNQIAQCESAGGNWRDVIAALRQHTPALWQKLDITERKRFLRHCQTWWDAHRHRIAPDIAERLQQMQQQKLLTVIAGRIVDLQDTGIGCRLTIQTRGAARHEGIDVGAVISCMGPETHIDNLKNPLLRSLQKRGLISQDEASLGIRVANDYAVLDANGRASGTIYYVGPWLRATFWEATAVPELREHVARLVDVLIRQREKAAASRYGRT